MAVGREVTPATSAPLRRPAPLLRAAFLACLVVGALLLAIYALGMWNGYSDQQQLNQQWQQEVGKAPLTPPTTIDRSLQKPVKGVDFAIRVPKLQYFAAVREGTSTSVLYSGPGHYPGTVWPGDQGTVGVAAHNVYWINFPELKSHDEIDIETRYGTYKYWVTGSKVVNPDDRTVLVSHAPGYNLVLTTCWPLWAGAFATQRYVIFASQYAPRIGPVPSTS